MIRAAFFILAAAVLPLAAGEPTTPDGIAREIIAPLIDPAKVATLKGDRPANARLYRVLYWLETARRAGGNPPDIIAAAQASAGYAGTKGAEADKKAIVWSRQKLEGFGCFTPAGLAKLRKGGSPAITRGEHAGDKIALDHVLPRAIVPELAARFYNLEAIPSKVNAAKSADLTEREIKLARRWHRASPLVTGDLTGVFVNSATRLGWRETRSSSPVERRCSRGRTRRACR